MAHWWSAPHLRTEESDGEERHVDFLDLFYDLIFVVAIAQVAHALAAHTDLRGVLEFAVIFPAIAWLWMGNTYYTDRFETDDASHRVFTFMQMLPVVGLAVFVHDALHDTAVPFILSYVAGRLMVILLWIRGSVHHPSMKPLVQRIIPGFSLGAALCVVSICVEGPARPILWLSGIAVDLLTPVLSRRALLSMPRFSRSRLAERFGLFTIIVLGESVAGTANGLAQVQGLGPTNLLTGGLAMAFAFCLFWLYFHTVPRKRLKQGFWPLQLRNYLHIPLLGALTATGAGVLAMVGHEGEVVEPGALRVLAWSLSLALLCLVGLSRVHQYMDGSEGRRARTEGGLWLSAALAFTVGLLATALHPGEVIGGLLAVLVTLIMWDMMGRSQRDPASNSA